jgi:peptidoglycan/LPS O-acetylase OafA/YrhL
VHVALLIATCAAAYTLYRFVEHPLEIRIRESGTAMPMAGTRAAS